jgi:hypothetical protein
MVIRVLAVGKPSVWFQPWAALYMTAGLRCTDETPCVHTTLGPQKKGHNLQSIFSGVADPLLPRALLLLLGDTGSGVIDPWLARLIVLLLYGDAFGDNGSSSSSGTMGYIVCSWRWDATIGASWLPNSSEPAAVKWRPSSSQRPSSRAPLSYEIKLPQLWPNWQWPYLSHATS